MFAFMRLNRLWVAVLVLAGTAYRPSGPRALAYPDGSIAYPSAPKVDQADDFHGVKVPDPFRKLEDADTPETRAWIEAENKLTFDFLGKIPAREKIKARLTKVWDFERYGLPYREGGRYFYSKNDGLQNQSVLYTVTSLEAEPKVLLDPNKLSADGTVALSGSDVSDDGKLMAYGLADKGSDWQNWRVRDIETGNDLPDLVKWIKFSGGTWTKDGKGFFYSRYDEPKPGEELKGANYFQKLYYHKLGTPQSEDVLIYERPDQKEWGFDGEVTEDGRFLVISVWKGTERKKLVFYKDLQTPGAKVVELIAEFEADYTFIGNEGPLFWLQTDLNAPKGRVIAIDITKPEKAHWKEVIPEAKETLRSGAVSLVNNMFTANYLKDVCSRVKIFDTQGKFVRDVAFPVPSPEVGAAFGFGGKKTDRETFYIFTSFLVPSTVFRYDMETGQSTVFRKPDVDFDPQPYETKQIFYTSKDGTKIPMFITHRRGLKLDGSNPTYLYGYGGFNASMTPGFSIANAVWLEMGGVYAQANIRGGGEYGKEWHDAGKKLNKQNVFNDFIAAAEWLIANKYTSTPKLAIGGGSNGGLLVGACITQRPDLFGAALPAVGVMDMLRFHKFTIGWAWTSDYGSPDNPEEFKALYAYSPLHNVKSGTAYPPTLLTTGDHDDRVHPGHTFKFTAALQEAHAGPNPILARIQTKAGHGAGKPTSMQIEERADQWAFLAKVLNMNVEGALSGGTETPAKKGKPSS